LIEWPDLALDMVPENALSVEILITGELERQIKFSWSCSHHWSDRIENISEYYIAN
jgi:tRNA A37 threonylcarbamoyladenosine biosynthesis protein TsaE